MLWKSPMKDNKLKRINKMQEIMSKLKKKKPKNILLNRNSNNLKGNSSKIRCSSNSKGLNWLKYHHQYLLGKFPTKMHFETSSFTNAKSKYALFRLFIFHRYCPSERDMTTSFAKKVLCGKKKLLNLS